MSMVSAALRNSAGHPDAHCENRQKVIYACKPAMVASGRTLKACQCGIWFSLPSCHASRHKSCSRTCSQQQQKHRQACRTRQCAECGDSFIPRPNQISKGNGLFCSVACSLKSIRKTTRFKDAVRNAVRVPTPKFGSDNPCWKGGSEATRRRRKESGAAAAQLRAYRSANPHKTREWQQNRKNRKSGRIEYGTIPKLMAVQRGMCAYCRVDIRSRYHVDHIVPLSKGGKHEAVNVQLLCAGCNLHKSNRDPIVFAQLSGRLL